MIKKKMNDVHSVLFHFKLNKQHKKFFDYKDILLVISMLMLSVLNQKHQIINNNNYNNKSMIHMDNKVHMQVMELLFHPMVQVVIHQVMRKKEFFFVKYFYEFFIVAMLIGMLIHTINKQILQHIHMVVLIQQVLLVQQHHLILNILIINQILSIHMHHRIQ